MGIIFVGSLPMLFVDSFLKPGTNLNIAKDISNMVLHDYSSLCHLHSQTLLPHFVHLAHSPVRKMCSEIARFISTRVQIPSRFCYSILATGAMPVSPLQSHIKYPI